MGNWIIVNKEEYDEDDAEYAGFTEPLKNRQKTTAGHAIVFECGSGVHRVSYFTSTRSALICVASWIWPCEVALSMAAWYIALASAVRPSFS